MISAHVYKAPPPGSTLVHSVDKMTDRMHIQTIKLDNMKNSFKMTFRAESESFGVYSICSLLKVLFSVCVVIGDFTSL